MNATPSTVCTACGADAVIYAADGQSCKCDECGQFSQRNTTTQHTCHGAVFCGTPRTLAEAECPVCTPTTEATR